MLCIQLLSRLVSVDKENNQIHRTLPTYGYDYHVPEPNPLVWECFEAL